MEQAQREVAVPGEMEWRFSKKIKLLSITLSLVHLQGRGFAAHVLGGPW